MTTGDFIKVVPMPRTGEISLQISGAGDYRMTLTVAGQLAGCLTQAIALAQEERGVITAPEVQKMIDEAMAAARDVKPAIPTPWRGRVFLLGPHRGVIRSFMAQHLQRTYDRRVIMITCEDDARALMRGYRGYEHNRICIIGGVQELWMQMAVHIANRQVFGWMTPDEVIHLLEEALS